MTESSNKELAQKKWIEDKIKFYKTVYKSDERNAKLLAYGDAIEALTAARHKRNEFKHKICDHCGEKTEEKIKIGKGWAYICIDCRIEWWQEMLKKWAEIHTGSRELPKD
jgi:NTP pyrophosphohydrolases containing a Zn-finger, probably nucleic-acid-binding